MEKITSYYVVWKGWKTGIFESWDECKRCVYKYTGARFKKFDTFTEAEQAFKNKLYNPFVSRDPNAYIFESFNRKKQYRSKSKGAYKRT